MKDSEKLDLQDLDSVSGGFNYAQLTREELNKFNELKDHFYKVCADCEEGKASAQEMNEAMQEYYNYRRSLWDKYD